MHLDRPLFVALVAWVGTAFAVAPWPSVVGASVALSIARARGLGLAWLLVAGVAFGASAARSELAAQAGRALYERGREALAPPRRCAGRGVVVSSPVRRAGIFRAVVALQGACGTSSLAGPTRVALSGLPADAGRGDALVLTADVGLLHAFENEGTGSGVLRVARGGVVGSGRVVRVERMSRASGLRRWIDQARASVRARIDATYHPAAAPLGRALVLGETDLDAEEDRAFRVTGLSHLLAVSGTHLVVAILSIAGLLRAALLRFTWLAVRVDVRRVVAAVVVPLALLYADFAGGSGSVLRAAAMLAAASATRMLDARPDAARVFAAAVLVGVALDPLAALDVSFTLSAAATGGLLLGARPLAAWLGGGPEAEGLGARARRGLAEAAAATLAATLACAPVIAVISPTLPILGLAANLVAAPLGEAFALPFCLAHAALGWWPWLERLAAHVGSGALLAVRAVAHAAAATGLALPVPPPTSWQLALVGAGAFAVAVCPRRRGWILLAASLGVAALEVGAARRGAPTGLLRVSALDVAQGDALIVDLPGGQAMLVDAGGLPGGGVDVGERVVVPALRARRRRRLDLVVVTHPHPDHTGGLDAVVREVEVGEVWHPGRVEPGSAFAATLEALRARGVTVRTAPELCGVRHVRGGAAIDVLSPCPDDPRDDANDASLVLRVTHGARAALLVGDAEERAEARLVERFGAELRADLLKVGHHGSDTSSTPAFLDAVRPEVALVSCGVRNRFGHPDPIVLAALQRRGVEVLRTDRDGEARWITDGDRTWSSPRNAERPPGGGLSSR